MRIRSRRRRPDYYAQIPCICGCAPSVHGISADGILRLADTACLICTDECDDYVPVRPNYPPSRLWTWDEADLDWRRPAAIGADEFCNPVLIVKTGRGALLFNLRPRMRHAPCDECDPPSLAKIPRQRAR